MFLISFNFIYVGAVVIVFRKFFGECVPIARILNIYGHTHVKSII